MIFNRQEFLFAILLIFAFPWTFKYSFLFRPEILLMCFAFLSFVLIERYLKPTGGRSVYLIPAGLISGLAVATHLNGIVVTGAGFLLLLVNRKWSGAFIFGFSSLLTTAIYFFDFNPDHSFNWWYYQFSSSPALDSIDGIPFYLQPFVNLIKEHQRFFHNPKIIIFSLFLLAILLSGGKKFWQQYRQISLYTILLAVLTAFIAVHKSRQYILIYFPFLVIMISKIYFWVMQGEIRQFKAAKLKFTLYSLLVLLLLFLSGSAYYNIRLLSQKFSARSNALITQEHLKGHSLENTNIIAPMTFIFNEIESIGRIHGEVCYTEMQKADPEIYADGFLAKADEFDIDFIHLSPYYRTKLGLGNYLEGSIYGENWLTKRNDDTGIYLIKLKPNNNSL
jgi:hypothetical protein